MQEGRLTKSNIVKFHGILDDCINKLNTEKNRNKPHWSEHSIKELRDMLLVESYELNHIVNKYKEHPLDEALRKDIKEELKDIINISLMLWDNLRTD